MRALVIGAGLAGLALAIGLRRASWQVTIVDCRERSDEPEGAGLLLTGNGTRALRSLIGTEPERDLARLVRSVSFLGSSGEPLFEVDCRSDSWPPFYTLRHRALRGLLSAAAHCEVLHGLTVEHVAHTQPPHVLFSDGTTGAFDLLVGADGVHSRTRRQLFPASSASAIEDFQGFRFITKCPPGLDEPQHVIGNGSSLILYPLPDNELYVGAGPIAQDRLAGAHSDFDVVQAVFADYRGAAAGVIASLEQQTRFIRTRYWQVAQQPWHLGDCVLIGDAAHACAPTLAQGAALALEDAVVLAREVADGPLVSAALERFEARRRARVERIQAESLRRMAANRIRATHALRVRDEATRRFGRTDLEQFWNRLIHELP